MRNTTADQTRIINSQTHTLTRMDEELANLSLQHGALDEGARAGFARVDKDLEALNDRVDRRREECMVTENKLQAAEGRVEVLEERLRTQQDVIRALLERVDGMEGRLCHCGEGKDRQVLGEISVLDSPIILGQDVLEDNVSDDSYHTPPIASSSMVPSSSTESDKENSMVLYDSKVSMESRLVEVEEEFLENVEPVVVPAPVLDTAGVARLIAVRHQRAVRSQGPPKSSYHPYAFCFAIGERSS